MIKSAMKLQKRLLQVSFLVFTLMLIVASMSFIVVGQEGEDEESDEPIVCVLDDLHVQDMSSTVGGASGRITNKTDPEVSVHGIRVPGVNAGLSRNIGSATVAVIVIDDFISRIPNAAQTHGGYVREVVQEIVSVPVRRNQPPPSNITVLELDYYPENSLSIIHNRLEDMINNEPYDFFVVNMSWVILICKQDIVVNLADNPEQPVTIPLDIPFYNRIWRSPREELEGCLPSEQSQQAPICSEIRTRLSSRDDLAEYDTVINNILETYGEDNISTMNVINFLAIIKGIDINIETESGQQNFLALRRSLATAIHQAATSDEADITAFRESLNRDNILPVAASGNFNLLANHESAFQLPPDVAGSNGRRDAFAPAIWTEVLAVSGSPANAPTGQWEASHDGQVSSTAAWVEFFSTNEVGSGTSFAAPIVSGHIARYATRCDVRPLLGLGKEQNRRYVAAIRSEIIC
jgi:hypothetical protein